MAEGHCSHCTQGVLATGNPKGSLDKIGGVEAYFTKPEGTDKKKSAVIIITDVFGHKFSNSQLIADSITNHSGILTVIPDLFNGDAVDISVMTLPEKDRGAVFGTWFAKHGPPESKNPIIRAVAKDLREHHGVQKIGIIGYCYGGRISAVMASEDGIDASAIAHPAKLNIPAEIDAIKVPTLWLCAETDSTFPKDTDRKVAQELLEKRGMKAIFKDYPGTTHGFAVRGDESDKQVLAGKIGALEATIEFFKNEL